ncbi:MAG: Gfo/Idh/MocA family oxidoreductase [Planctomycetes bacterium]|nr:Gfo/Idh/MocA family oxidoreductase [Planctomycetota bacterium]
MSLTSQSNRSGRKQRPVLNVAMVGHAFMGRAHGNAWRQAEHFFDLPMQIVPKVVVGRDQQRAAAAATKLGFETASDDLDAVLADPDIQLVDVATPNDSHYEIAMQALRSKKHVLCEKPLAPSLAAADRMLAAARAADRRLMMGSKFRYTPDVTEARALLDREVCGDPVLYENVFCSHVDMTQRWNSRPEVSGGGVLIDNGCHSVDLARYLLGPLSHVQVQFGRRVQDVPVEDTARMLFQSHSGALGSIDLSWSVHKQTDAYVRIIGTAGTLEIGWQGSRWKATDGDWQPFGVGYDKVTAFRTQLENFFASVRGEAAPVIDDTDARASVEVIDCAYRAAREERWIPIPTT